MSLHEFFVIFFFLAAPAERDAADSSSRTGWLGAGYFLKARFNFSAFFTQCRVFISKPEIPFIKRLCLRGIIHIFVQEYGKVKYDQMVFLICLVCLYEKIQCSLLCVGTGKNKAELVPRRGVILETRISESKRII